MVEPIAPGLVPSIIRIITVYDRRDPDDGGPSGDYIGVKVVFDVEEVATFGDEYHDKGLAKAHAFIAGAAYAWKEAYGLPAPKTWMVDSWPTE